jgi:toxin CcdB
MAQFDVYDNPNPATAKTVPFLLEVQSDLLEELSTRVVVPLVSAEAMGQPARHLNPLFEINDRPVVMSIAELAGISRRHLGAKVTSLAGLRQEIMAALDFLFTGF